MNKKQTQYHNESQQRIMKLMLLMFNDPVQGMSPVQIARELSVTPSMVTRDLANLKEAGIAERDEALQTWRLTALLPQQNLKALTVFERLAKKTEEIKKRYL